MKRLILPLACLAILTFACGLPTTVTPVVTKPPATKPPTLQPTWTEPPTATPTEAPISTKTSVAANVICQGLALYVDPGLASGYKCETIPESTAEMEVYPQYTKLTLQGYVLSGKFFAPQLSVFPVQRYAELLPDFVPMDVANLQALIGGSPAPSFAESFGTSLPFLPVFNAGQVFFARYQLVPFVSGSGIRYLTELAQYYAPVNNTDLFYTYQGLTSDGKYWVSAILPINHPMLPADATNPPGDSEFKSYIIDMVNQLNAQAPDSFTPTLTALDALVSSITIQP